jgi:hypothetical protein
LFSTFCLCLPLSAEVYSGVVQPTGITLGPSQQQQFTLSGYGDNILWSVQPPSMGTITSTGYYTASSAAGVAYIYAQPVGSTSSYMSLVYQSAPGVSTSPTVGANSGPTSGGSPLSPTPSPTTPAPVTPAPSPTAGPSPTGPTVGPTPYQPSDPGPTVGPTAPGVSVLVTPASSYLQAGQSMWFTALVQGTSMQQVQWSISPAMGSIVNGYYTAPPSISSETQVTISATSIVNPSITATATVLLAQPLSPSLPTVSNVSVSIAQGTTTLQAGQSTQFTASVQGGLYSGVLWSLTPNVGTLANGFYTAPANITSQETITVTAASLADPSKTASVSVILQPTAPSLVVNVSVWPASASLKGGQSTTFTPTVSGTSNTAVSWSLSPQVGTIANGVYQAPATIASQQTVTITAASAADPSKTASASVILQPTAPSPVVNLSVSPTSASLKGGQSTTFTPTVSGTSNTAVSWSLSPQVGTIANGVYQAPATIASQQTVTITATSAADPSKTASASVILQPTAPSPVVNLSVSPTSASLTGGQSSTFTPTVSGTSNTAVTWSLSPQVGTIAGGVYQAPSIIASQQTVTLTATSVADSSKTASATVTLQPIGVTVGPASASLAAGQSATFTAGVTGTGNTAVTWSLSPAVGSIVNGVYTAPATISSAQTVTLTVASKVDSTKTASATITLTAASSSNPPPTTIALPLEVIGPNGTTVSATVSIPSGTNLSGTVLWMQIHGLRYQTQASVQVNNSSWIPINSSTVTLLGNANAYGGIGGGFSTLQMNMNLPAGTLHTGNNNISFRFNQTDGRVSGFRVLAFNFQASNGANLLPSSAFVETDPNTWQPPSSSASDIAAGQTLWHTAALTIPVLTGGTQPIVAHCSDCHAQDGRDLKYFNYSNNSIQARALFHGLTAQQGDQIASYIRTINVPNPGMPWNPPYQPGPGLDSQPVNTWAAGAGLNAVVDSDADMVNAIFPSGFQSSVFAAASRLDQREIPLALQLPDWNQWLPGTSPMDAFGSTFTTNGYNTIYQLLSSSLQANNPAVYLAQRANFQAWFNAFYGLYQQVGTPIWNNPTALWTPANVDAMYSLSQWGLVKNWELNNQFQLEGMAQNIFGPQADPRAWYSNNPFFVSPHELKMPNTGVTGLRNGTQATYIYLSYIWYNLQLILNDSNGQQQEQFPIDWPYANGFVMNLGELLSPQAGPQTMWMIKGLQILQQAGTGPQLGLGGWQPNITQPSLLVTREWIDAVWSGVDQNARVAIATGVLQSWLQQASQFTPQQFYAGGWTTASAVPIPFGSAYDNVFPDWVWYMIPRFSFIGVNSALVSQVAQWAKTIWPNANWTADLNATCSWQDTYTINCSE